MFRNFPAAVMRIVYAMRDADGEALLVGGSVRDMILDIPPKDFDIEVYRIESDRLEEILRSLNPQSIDAVGRSYGVFKIKFEGAGVIDVSIPRRDSKKGSGHKNFEVTGDPWMSRKEAARRRDFTINAMAIDTVTGGVFDFFKGQEDLKARILRATDPVKFRQDPLRVLRAMQFAARFGFMVEPQTLAICNKMVRRKEFLDQPNARIGEEWRKLLLKSPKPSVGLRVGLAMGAFHVLHPELVALIGCLQDSEWHPEGDVWEHSLMTVDAAAEIVRQKNLGEDDALVILLGSLCHDFGKPAVTKFEANAAGDLRWRCKGHEAAGVAPTLSFLSRMEFGKDVEDKVVPLVADHLFPSHVYETGRYSASVSAIRRLADRLAPAAIQELVWVAEADHRGRALPFDGFPAGEKLLARAAELTVRERPLKRILKGQHLIDHFGLKPWPKGPKFQPILDAVFQAQLDGGVTTLEEALAMAQEIANGGMKQK